MLTALASLDLSYARRDCMIKQVQNLNSRAPRIVSFAAMTCVLFMLCAAPARSDDGNNNACNVIATYSQMVADHDKLVPLVQFCQNSYRCAATRQTMITMGRTDVDMLNCDHAPAPSAQDIAVESCSSLMSRAIELSTGYAISKQEIARLTSLCNT